MPKNFIRVSIEIKNGSVISMFTLLSSEVDDEANPRDVSGRNQCRAREAVPLMKVMEEVDVPYSPRRKEANRKKGDPIRLL